jgi:hypothetical protein
MGAEAFIMRFKSSTLVTDFSEYTRDFIRFQKYSPKKLGQVTSVAKQPKPAVQSKCFENVNCEMQLPAYQNEGVRDLGTATAFA